MANKSRPLQRVLYLFCEGDTEFHYFTGFKTSNRFSFTIKPVDVKGGGYAKMTAEVIRTGTDGSIARVILIDLDRYMSHPGEKAAFNRLLNIVQSHNVRGWPTFLIVSNPDFDDFVLLHDPKYHFQEKAKFLSSIGYNDVDDFKGDDKVYAKFNTNGTRKLENALSRINPNYFVKNTISLTKSTYAIKNTVEIIENNESVRTSNIADMFCLIEQLL